MSVDPKPPNTSAQIAAMQAQIAAMETQNRLQSHFWITATASAIHVFLMSSEKIQQQPTYEVVAVGTTIWLIATYLITEIAAAGPGGIPSPKVAGHSDDPCIRKFIETYWNIRLFWKRLWFVLLELKGSFFYLVIVLCSFIGLLSVRGCNHPVRIAFGLLLAAWIISWLFDRVLKIWYPHPARPQDSN